VIVISFTSALLLAVAGSVVIWALRDGLGPGMVGSHGREAWERFLEGAIPLYLFCGVIALPGVMHAVLKRLDARSARKPARDRGEDERSEEHLETAPGWQTLWTVCMCYGAAFGAACGALCGTVSLWSPAGQLAGALVGLLMGTLGGWVYAVVGTSLGGPVGWGLAGLLGTLAPTALVGFLLGRNPVSGSIVTGIALAGLTSGCLGLAVAHGLDTGQSRVPGVQGLVEVIQEVTLAKRSGSVSDTAAEITPAAPPEGRGDEAAPTAMPRARDE
jgi:hypothetical protein